MTLLELKIIIDRKIESREDNKNTEVVIVNNKPSFGARSTTKVKYVNTGFDWERGLFLIVPEIELCEVEKSKH